MPNYPPDSPPDGVRLALVKLLTRYPNQTARWYADEAILDITSVQNSLAIMKKKGLVGRQLQHPEKPPNGTYNQYLWHLVVEVV